MRSAACALLLTTLLVAPAGADSTERVYLCFGISFSVPDGWVPVRNPADRSDACTVGLVAESDGEASPIFDEDGNRIVFQECAIYISAYFDNLQGVVEQEYLFEKDEGQWYVLGHMLSRSEATPIVVGEWSGLEGDTVRAARTENGSYAGLQDFHRVLVSHPSGVSVLVEGAEDDVKTKLLESLEGKK